QEVLGPGGLRNHERNRKMAGRREGPGDRGPMCRAVERQARPKAGHLLHDLRNRAEPHRVRSVHGGEPAAGPVTALRSHLPSARNSTISRLKASASSTAEQCMAPGRVTRLAPGILAWSTSAMAGGVPGSFSPTMTRVGERMAPRRGMRFTKPMA